MKSKAKWILLVCLLFLLLLFTGYVLLAFYYRDGFGLNTWINGVYCTGKTVEEVNAELLSQMKAPIVVITDQDGKSYTIDMEQAGFTGDYLPSLNRYMQEQSAWLWVDNITFHREHELVPAATYDEEQLRAAFLELDPIRRELQSFTGYGLCFNAKDGYRLYDSLSNRLDTEKVFQVLKEGIDEGNYVLDLREIDCYYDIPLTKEQEEIRQFGEKVEAFEQCNIVYDMGDEQDALDPSTMATFLKTEPAGERQGTGLPDEIPVVDEAGNLVLDEEGIAKFVAAIAREYDTYGKERTFQSTRGDAITISGGTYGTRIDQEAEVAWLLEHLLSAESHNETVQLHIPAYEREAFVRGRDDIGDTYIEIDMTEQMLYYYEEGELMLETEVVTGNTGRRMGTPEGVNYVYAKQKNRVLRGPGYASPVKYWMPVRGNIGIHDASWRSEFGGTIYQTNGSHGCINTPTDKMAELYDMVKEGTPVIMFY